MRQTYPLTNCARSSITCASRSDGIAAYRTALDMDVGDGKKAGSSLVPRLSSRLAQGGAEASKAAHARGAVAIDPDRSAFLLVVKIRRVYSSRRDGRATLCIRRRIVGRFPIDFGFGSEFAPPFRARMSSNRNQMMASTPSSSSRFNNPLRTSSSSSSVHGSPSLCW